MATRDPQELTEAWTEITAAFTLVDDQLYVLQNTGGASMFYREAASEPDASDVGMLINPNKSWFIRPTSTMNIYLRATRDAGTTATVTESRICQ